MYFASVFDRVLKLCGWGTVNTLLPTNWSDREKAYTELQATLGQEGIRLIRMRRGVSSGSEEQVGSSSQSTETQTNTDKDEMEDVVDGEENVEHEEEVVRNDDDKEEEEDVLDENEEKEGEEDEDEDGEKVEEEVLEEGEEEGEEEEGESDVVRELLSKHSVWLGM